MLPASSIAPGAGVLANTFRRPMVCFNARYSVSVSQADYTPRTDFYIPRSSAYSGSSGAVETGTLVPEAPGRRLRRRPMCPVTDDPLPPRPDRARGIVFR